MSAQGDGTANGSRRSRQADGQVLSMAERAKQRKARRAGWRTQTKTASTGCWAKYAATVFMVINISFVVLGIVLIALGFYAVQSTWAEFFGTGPGYSIVALGFATIVTAVCGIIGMKRDSKFLLLVYFVVLTTSFMCYIIMGGVIAFNNTKLNEKFSGWWDEFPDAAEKGQKEFNCCGYANVTDRPVGNCSAIVPVPTQGCKEVGLDYMRERFVPLFMCTFAFGVAMFFAIIVSMKLLCKSTMKRLAPQAGVEDAHQWNTYSSKPKPLLPFTPMPASQPAKGTAATNAAPPTELAVA